MKKPLNKQFMFFPLVCIHFGFSIMKYLPKNPKMQKTNEKREGKIFLTQQFYFLTVIYSTARISNMCNFPCWILSSWCCCFSNTTRLDLTFKMKEKKSRMRSTWLWGVRGRWKHFIWVCVMLLNSWGKSPHIKKIEK